MKEWIETGMHQVNALLGWDSDFLVLMEQLTTAQQGYHAAIRKLSMEDQQIIEDYIALCEEAECQKTHTAYYCGKRNG